MKRFWLLTMAAVLVAAFTVPAFAWEYSMSGEFQYRFRYLGRTGSQDLFGNAEFQNNPLNAPTVVANGGLIGFAGPNFFRGYNGGTTAMNTGYDANQVRIVRGGFSLSGSDGYANDQKMKIVPTIRINNAHRLHGVIDFASYRQRYNHRDVVTNGPLDLWYQDRFSAAGTDTAMIPSISQWRLTSQLPWGVLSIGAKDFPFGTGSLLAYNTRASALLMVIPYGPFRLMPSIWLDRNPEGYSAYAPYNGSAGPALVQSYDGGTHHEIQWSFVFTYDNGPINAGGGFVHQRTHYDAANNNVPLRSIQHFWNDAAQAWVPRGQDISLLLWTWFLKYNNGRFFANFEYDWVNQQNTFVGASAAGGAFSGAPQINTEASQAFAELGVLSGPAKLAFMFAWSGGQVLNDYNPTKSYNGLAINYQASDPYNYLMFKTYGGGNDGPWASGVTFTRDENGQMTDAYALAARLDYAVAANLNLYGTYMWAHRVEQNGFYAGWKNSSGVYKAGYNAVAAQAWRAAALGGGTNQNPFVDDGYLGWEMNFGVDWKLLENFTLYSRYAYWQPGPWFNQAYSTVGGMVGTANQFNDNGALNGRSAIQVIDLTLGVDF